jgi:hypothetical protein
MPLENTELAGLGQLLTLANHAMALCPMGLI